MYMPSVKCHAYYLPIKVQASASVFVTVYCSFVLKIVHVL